MSLMLALAHSPSLPSEITRIFNVDLSSLLFSFEKDVVERRSLG